MAKKSKKKNNQHQRAYFAAEYANHIMNFYGVDREMSCADLKSILCAPRIFSQMGNDPVQALNVERSLFAMMKWRKAKQAYRFNPVFLEELSTNVSLNFPFSAWHLPFSSYYVDLLNWDKKINDEPIYGAYFYFGPADHNGIEDTLLTITIVTEAVNQRTNLFRMINFSIFLSGDEQLTVHDAISQISDYGEIHEDSKTLVSDSTHLAETLCMIASYISSSEPDIKKREKWIGATRIQNGKTIRSTVQLWDVGYRFYKDCIKKSVNKTVSQQKMSVRVSPRAHIRKGHFHLYWCGKGRKEPRIRWIRETMIGKYMEDLPTVVRQDFQEKLARQS